MWEAIAEEQPEWPAHICGDEVLTWGEFSARSDALAEGLVAAGLGAQSRVAVNLIGGAPLLETYFAAFKAGLTPVAVSIDLPPEALADLYLAAGVEAVIFEARFAWALAAIRANLPGVRRWIVVAQPGWPSPGWAEDYETLAAAAPCRRPYVADWDRSPDDCVLSYGPDGPDGAGSLTVQTWRQEELFTACEAAAGSLLKARPVATASGAARRVARSGPRRPMFLSEGVLTHGGDIIQPFAALNLGGTVIAVLPGGFVEDWKQRCFGDRGALLTSGCSTAAAMLEACGTAKEAERALTALAVEPEARSDLSAF